MQFCAYIKLIVVILYFILKITWSLIIKNFERGGVTLYKQKISCLFSVVRRENQQKVWSSHWIQKEKKFIFATQYSPCHLHRCLPTLVWHTVVPIMSAVLSCYNCDSVDSVTDFSTLCKRINTTWILVDMFCKFRCCSFVFRLRTK